MRTPVLLVAIQADTDAATGTPIHDLRHSYATGPLKAGINAKVISARIHHANVGT